MRQHPSGDPKSAEETALADRSMHGNRCRSEKPANQFTWLLGEPSRSEKNTHSPDV